ncbi:relaxase/mobilization nuclease domain-containing protein [Williamsia sterculiae]|nr:relaxase/mobilization nuclease domain-containing protein [Williamsia sterculiae]
MPNIERGAKMAGLVSYLFGPGRANEHTNPHVVAASSEMLVGAGGYGAVLDHGAALEFAGELDTARVVFGTRVTRTDKQDLRAAQQRGFTGSAAIAEATHDENVWHCSLSLAPDEEPLTEQAWATVAREFMGEMGFDSPGDASARWAAVHHGTTKAGGDHIHIVASRVRDDGSVVKLWFPEPGQSYNTGDAKRSQRVCADIERRHGLRVTQGRARQYPSKGSSPAQENIAGRTGRPEPVKDTLARTVRAVAYGAESETEFVRLARAHGLLIRPRYAAGSRTEVVGYSVALPTARYATRDGHPVWHGGGKLANDLTLPRLREHWPAPDDAQRSDALSAWAHNQRETIDPNHFPTTAAPAPQRPGRAPRGLNHAEAKERLRSVLRELARNTNTEAGFVRAAAAHPDVLIRPRYAKGSDTDVVGYSAALRPQLYADADGKPIWHGGGKLDNRLSLPNMRASVHWRPPTLTDQRAAQQAWASLGASPSAAGGVDTDPAQAAAAWRSTVDGLSGNERARVRDSSWARAASETAGFASAWAVQTEGDTPGDMSRLADALSDAAGGVRSPEQPGRRVPGPGQQVSVAALRRIAATMLAASHDDPRYAWQAMFSQLAATSRAISDGLRAQGYESRATAIETATVRAERSYTAQAPAAAPDRAPADRPMSDAQRAARMARVSHPTDPTRAAQQRSQHDPHRRGPRDAPPSTERQDRDHGR